MTGGVQVKPATDFRQEPVEPLLRSIGRDALLWLIGSLCNLYRIPFSAPLIAQQFPPPCTLATIHESARAVGLKTGDRSLSAIDWARLPLPVIAFYRKTSAASLPGAESVEPAAETLEPILILKRDERTLLYFRAGSKVPEIIRTEEAVEKFDEALILVTHEKASNDDAIPGFETEKKPFGFRWFVPELLKHKHIWRDVLLASFAIQLVGLATPLFTQVIIDKVIAHQSESTLIVLGVALVMFMLFTSVMSWLRQYLVLHTGNRIDAVLGSQLLRHLLRLPLPYFERRPVGTLVARLQGLETIREFISGASISLILDFPFLLIFLSVMFAYSWKLSPSRCSPAG